ncbi:MAG: NADH-quinone oxidoreductase subunit M [Opitutales bacterium]|nr:NADH-quinone oxidoreductase subunit M [Opitutales bacterium]
MNCGSSLLQVAVAAPLVAALVMAFSKWLPCAAKKAVAGVGFVVPALAALALCCAFPCAEKIGGYAFYSSCETIGVPSLGIWLQFGLNGISLPLFLMATIVGLAAGLRAIATKGVAQSGLYYAVTLVMFGGVLGVFSAIDVFSFYIFHEFALIPTFVAILLWGGYARKTTAITMAIYLTLGAMVSLAGLFALYFAGAGAGEYGFSFLGVAQAVAGGIVLDGNVSVIFALLLFGFGILVSLFPFYSWAPDTYSVAPTPISMLHAGVLKKFGLYGLIQLGALALPLGLADWQNWIIWLALGNIVLIGLITMVQKDLKQMVSYSSVMHMGPIFLGIAAFAISGGDTAGLGGAVVLMFAHGLSVALLFHLGQSVYDRTGTYDMTKMGGLTAKAPVLAAFFVAATMASIGLPGFANFWGELTIFTSLAQIQPTWLLGAIVLSIVISAIYGLRAVAKIFYGKNTGAALSDEAFENVREITTAERVPAIVLFAALVAVGFVPSLITKNIDATLKADFAPAAKELCADCGSAPAETDVDAIILEGSIPVEVPADNCEACGGNAEQVVLAKNITVSVDGAVGNPGDFVLSGDDATLLKVLEQAEVDEEATFVVVLRVRARIPVDIEELRNGDVDDIPLEDGDKISVE